MTEERPTTLYRAFVGTETTTDMFGNEVEMAVPRVDEIAAVYVTIMGVEVLAYRWEFTGEDLRITLFKDRFVRNMFIDREEAVATAEKEALEKNDTTIKALKKGIEPMAERMRRIQLARQTGREKVAPSPTEAANNPELEVVEEVP